FSTSPPPPRSTLLPYTTLFRSSDERDALLRAAAREVGVLREEAVARVDRVRLGLTGDPQDLLDVEVGAHGVPLLPHRVRLIRLEDRKSTRLNSSHVKISYAVFC